jgi:PKD repeat protein
MKKRYFLFLLTILSFAKIGHTQINCNAAFTITVNGNTVAFLNNGIDSNATHHWYFGDGTTSTVANPVHSYPNCGTYNVYHGTNVNNPNGVSVCQDSTFQTIVIACNTPCSAQAFFTSMAVNNQSNVIEFINGSTTGAGQQVMCNWIFGDGTSSTSQSLANQVHTYTASGVYNVCLVVTSGTLGTSNICRDTFCSTVQVQVTNPTPCNVTASFVADTVTNGFSFNFTNTSLNLNPSDSITWNFGDGSFGYDVNPTHTYTSAGTYNVCLRIYRYSAGASPCISEVCRAIQIFNPTPTPCNIMPSFMVQPAPNTMQVFQFVNTSITANAPLVTWTFGDSTTGVGNSITHSFANPGTYTVCMHVSVSATCASDTCINITLADAPTPCNIQPNFTWQASPSNSNTGVSNQVYFINNTPNLLSTDSVTWIFGDSTISHQTNPTHVFANAGTYRVCLIVRRHSNPGTAACVEEVCHTIQIVPNVLSYPNPAHTTVSVNVPLTQAQPINAFVYNMQNNLVAQVLQAGVVGNNILTFNVAGLAPGIYNIRIYVGGQVIISRFVKQ